MAFVPSSLRPAVRSRRFPIDLGEAHPGPGALVGLILIAGLVPLLELSGGPTGTLGPSIPLVFLVPVLLAAAVGGRTVGVAVAVVAIGTWDWFFIPPFHQVTIYEPRDVLALVVFLAVALLT